MKTIIIDDLDNSTEKGKIECYYLLKYLDENEFSYRFFKEVEK